MRCKRMPKRMWVAGFDSRPCERLVSTARQMTWVCFDRLSKTSSTCRKRHSTDLECGAAVDEELHACDKIRFVGYEEQRRIGHIPGRAHLMSQRHAGIALRGDLGAALAAHPRAGVDRHRCIHQTRQDDVGTNAILGVLNRHLL